MENPLIHGAFSLGLCGFSHDTNPGEARSGFQRLEPGRLEPSRLGFRSEDLFFRWRSHAGLYMIHRTTYIIAHKTICIIIMSHHCVKYHEISPCHYVWFNHAISFPAYVFCMVPIPSVRGLEAETRRSRASFRRPWRRSLTQDATGRTERNLQAIYRIYSVQRPFIYSWFMVDQMAI